MGKKKFIDKKKSATFQLMVRDTSDPLYNEGPESDRVFVRVDNNQVSINGLDEEHDDSIYDDGDYEGFSGSTAPLPDNIRREILELGFPDDGYNYLTHLREIRKTGGGSTYYPNPNASHVPLADDVKAYDASRVRINEPSEDTSPKTLYNVAQSTLNVRLQKAIDPDIAKLLEADESDLGSEIDDLEEDFILQANRPNETGDLFEDECLTLVNNPQEELSNEAQAEEPICSNETGDLFEDECLTLVNNPQEELSNEAQAEEPICSVLKMVGSANEKARSQRLLDQQFDMLELQEYGSDSDGDYDNNLSEENTSLAEKLHNALKGQDKDDLDLDEDYKAPPEILRKCVEYAEKYDNDDVDNKEVVIVEESSDDSEIWDCETIVSTYSNLDNHPGRIGAPDIIRKKILAETVSGVLKSRSENIISLGGKARLPVDYLWNGKKESKEKVKGVGKVEQVKRKPHGQESKEEKKERKAAIKEERREARRLKKEMKGLYRDEAKLAQKVAAVSGPSSIHLM